MKKIITVILPLLLCLLVINCSEPTEPLILNAGKIHNELHQRNVGKITFLQSYVPLDQYQEKDFLKKAILGEDRRLFMRVFLEHTQTYYLQELAPELTPNQLCKKGNWQLTFYLDDQQVYQENISPGAGSCAYRNEQTVIGVPLDFGEQMDHWGEFVWLKMLKRGQGEKILAEGSHELKIEIRPYIKLGEVKVGEIVAKGQITLEKDVIDVSPEAIAYQPIQPTNAWPVSTDTFNKKRIVALNKKIAQRDFKNMTSVVVIKNGELLIEEYFNHVERNTLHDTRSVGKSFASTLVGIAVKEGHLLKEQVTLGEIFDLKKYQNYDQRKEKISLEDLMTMSSILEASDNTWESAGQEEKMYPSENWVQFGLDLPIDEAKVNAPKFDYSSVSSVLVGGAVHKSVPNGLENYLVEKVFQPLDITDYRFQYTPQKVLNTAGSIQLNSLDFAKYGQLYKNGGVWDGQQIIPKEWVQKSLTPLVPNEQTDSDGYGYFFWHKTYKVNGQSYPCAYASGNGGNRIIIFENLPLVIVITATAYGKPYAHFQADEIVKDYLLPAIS
ncbi:MAG: serine hydrolase [Bacteroidota bacterium]